MTPAKRSDPSPTIPDPTALEGQIQLRAYERYEARGREDGHDLEDWLQAEAELLGTRPKATAA